MIGEVQIGEVSSTFGCHFERRLYADQTSWDHQCNECMCTNGMVKCSKVRLRDRSLSMAGGGGIGVTSVCARMAW